MASIIAELNLFFWRVISGNLAVFLGYGAVKLLLFRLCFNKDMGGLKDRCRFTTFIKLLLL